MDPKIIIYIFCYYKSFFIIFYNNIAWLIDFYFIFFYGA